MTPKHLSEDRFDPENDPLIRKWASRFSLQADDTIVIMTAEIERLSTALQNEFKQVKTVVEGKQEGWLDTLTEALKVIQLQQENQAGLRENCKRLTTSLEQLEQKLNALELPTEIYLPELTDLSTDLQIVKADLSKLQQTPTQETRGLSAEHTQTINNSAKGIIALHQAVKESRATTHNMISKEFGGLNLWVTVLGFLQLSTLLGVAFLFFSRSASPW